MLVLVIGDEHTIVAWFVLRSESWTEMHVGLSFLRDRLQRLGTLKELEVWWTDRCCDGAADVTQHPLVGIMHGSSLTRAPRKDTFHAINGVNKTGNEGILEEKSQLGTDLFSALREIPDSELTPVVEWLQSQSGTDELSARIKARTKYRHSGIVRNFSLTPGRQLEKWQRVRNKWQVHADSCRRDGVRCVIRRKIDGRLQGTLEEMDCVEPHIRKGCLSDPWPMEEMYINTKLQPKMLLQERLRCGDSNRNEVRHRALNEIVEHVSRMGEDLMDADLDFFAIYFSNRKYDILFERVDEHSLGCFPWNDAYLNADAAEVLDGPLPFPSAAAASRRPLPPIEPIERDDSRWEPLGFTYLHYLKEMRSDAVVAAALAESEKAAVEEEPMEEELDDPLWLNSDPQLLSPISQRRRSEAIHARGQLPAELP